MGTHGGKGMAALGSPCECLWALQHRLRAFGTHFGSCREHCAASCKICCLCCCAASSIFLLLTVLASTLSRGIEHGLSVFSWSSPTSAAARISCRRLFRVTVLSSSVQPRRHAAAESPLHDIRASVRAWTPCKQEMHALRCPKSASLQGLGCSPNRAHAVGPDA